METGSSLLPAGLCTSARRLWRHRQAIAFSQSAKVLHIMSWGLVTSALDRLQRMTIAPPGQELPAPLFAIGHWRSGTTLLHELLCLDERYGYPNNHACMNPHHFLISGKGMRMMPAGTAKYRRPMDEMTMGMDSPQEDEFALLALGAPSPYEAFIFPHAMMQLWRYCDISALSRQEQDRWSEVFMRFLRLVSLENKGRRLVLKSPTHTYRINMLLKLFPRAQFVHIVRNPYAVFASTLRMLRAMFALYALTPVDDNLLEDFVIQNGILMESCLARDLPLLSNASFVQLRHEDLVQEPEQMIKLVYDKLGLEGSAELQERVALYFRQRNDYRASGNKLDQRQRALVAGAWESIFKKYGYNI